MSKIVVNLDHTYHYGHTTVAQDGELVFEDYRPGRQCGDTMLAETLAWVKENFDVADIQDQKFGAGYVVTVR